MNVSCWAVAGTATEFAKVTVAGNAPASASSGSFGPIPKVTLNVYVGLAPAVALPVTVAIGTVETVLKPRLASVVWSAA